MFERKRTYVLFRITFFCENIYAKELLKKKIRVRSMQPLHIYANRLRVKNLLFGAKRNLITSREWRDINEEREIHCRQKVIWGSDALVLTPHAGLNPRSKHALLSLTASLVSSKSCLVIFILCTHPIGFACQRKRLVTTPAKPGSYHMCSGNDSGKAGELSYVFW